MIWLLIKFFIKSQKFQKIHSKIIWEQLLMRIIKKYLKKDIYLQKKNEILLIMWDQNNSIIMKYQKMINFVHNKITDRITKVLKKSQQNN